VVLQPTSPLRTANDIDRAIEICARQFGYSTVSVSAAQSPGKWLYEVYQDGRLRPLESDYTFPADGTIQTPVYTLNGAVYVNETNALLRHGVFVSSDTFAYRMPLHRSIDIDTPDDLVDAESILRRCSENERDCENL
jgi:N-acylneuraminate cytidylyltransferase